MPISELSKTILEFYEKLSVWEESVVRDSGLTTAQSHTIAMVGHCGPLKMKDLADKIGVTTGTLTVGVDRLEKKGLLKRIRHESDRRSFLIKLTDKGHKAFEKHHTYHMNLTEEISSGLDPEEQRIFKELLQKAMQHI